MDATGSAAASPYALLIRPEWALMQGFTQGHDADVAYQRETNPPSICLVYPAMPS